MTGVLIRSPIVLLFAALIMLGSGSTLVAVGLIQYGDGLYLAYISAGLATIILALIAERRARVAASDIDPSSDRDLSFEFVCDAYNAIEALAAEHGAAESDIIAAIDAFEDEYPPELQERWWDAWEPPEVDDDE